MKHTGSCLCEAVKFEIEGDFERFFLCHCSRCRKNTGSAHAANLFSTTARLHWLSGEDNVKTFQLPGTRHGRSFCTECGSALPTIKMDGKLLVVPAGCLNTDVHLKPQGHIFMDSKANWDIDPNQVPHFDQLPG